MPAAGSPPQRDGRLVGALFACYVVIVGFFFTFLPFQFVYRAFHVPTYPLFAGLILAALGIAYLLLTRPGRPALARRACLAAALYLPFAAYALFSWLLTPDPQMSTVGLVGLFVLNPLFILFAVTASADARWAGRTIGVMGAAYVVAGLHALLSGALTFQASNFQSVFGIELIDGFEGAYQNESIFLGLGTVVAYAEATTARSKLAKACLLVLAGCGVGLIFASGGRSAFIGVVVTVAAHAWYALRRQIGSVPATLAVALLGYLAAVASPALVQDGGLADAVLLRRFSVAAGESGDAAGSRPYLFAKAVELWLSSGRTFLFGAGLGSYPAYIRAWSPGMYPHNVVLQLAAELGLAGLGLWLLPFLAAAAGPRGDHGDRPGPVVWLPCLFLWTTAMGSGDVGTVWMEVFLTVLCVAGGRAAAGAPQPLCGGSWRDREGGGMAATSVGYSR